MNEDTSRARALSGLMLVARRELAARARSTAFRVSTIILLAATVAGIAIPAALIGRTQRFTVAVAAQAPPAVAAAVRADGNAAGLQVTAVAAADRAAAVRSVEQGSVTAAVAAGGEIIWKAGPNSTLNPVLNAAVQQAVIIQRAAGLGLSAGATARLLAPVRVTVTQLHSQSQRTARTILANVGIVLLYVAITVYGGYVLTGVVEEKSSRVVEVLLSRLPPPSLLGGKIAGIGLAGLAQFAAVAATAAATLLVTRPSGLPPGTYKAIPALVLWFVLGYVFYSTLYGGLGSLASRTEDAQAAAGPVIALLIGIYALAFIAMGNPGAGWVTFLSMLPPSAPMFMPLRAALVNVPAWQLGVAVVLMLGGIYGLLRIGARLYRNAVLHTGARLRLREAWHGEPAGRQPVRR
jgi:ABC-2 type transport system permease protein